MSLPKQVKIVEVGPRDGLQNESHLLSLDEKVSFINQLSKTGLKHIEATSFVSPKWIPQLADHREVFKAIHQEKGIVYSALIPNRQGLAEALESGVKHIAVFTTSSELFSKKNTNCTVEESLLRIKEIIAIACKENMTVRAYLSCVIACPYEGKMAPDKVSALLQQLLDMGCEEVSLGDTIGVGTPNEVNALLDQVLLHAKASQLAVHFHDTFGQALANIYTALQYGIHIIDSSIAGLGGCPYARGAAGNVATEDVLYMLNGLSIETGVNLEKIIEVGNFITKLLKKPPSSKTHLALASSSSSVK